MSKLAALVAVLFLAAHVTSAFRAVITTVETDENPAVDRPRHVSKMSPECQQEAMQSDMGPCMQVVREMQHQQRGGRGGGETSMPEFDRCCSALRSFRSEKCMCEAMQDGLERMTARPEMEPGMRQTAANLPLKCDAASSPCQFSRQSRWF